MIVASGVLVPKQDTALARSTSDLVRRGLQLVDASAQRDVFISETECIVLRTKYNEAWRKMGELRNVAWRKMGELRQAVPNHWKPLPRGVVSGDLNDFLEAFDRVKLNEGYVLDYGFDFGIMGGGPLVYAREVDSEPMSCPEEYRDAFGLPNTLMLTSAEPTCADSLPYPRHMRFDRNATGYFQFALFCMTLRRFYLVEHSCNYRRYPIFTDSDLRDCLEDELGIVSDADRLRLLKLNLQPRVRLRDG